jgi:LysM repeat protein
MQMSENSEASPSRSGSMGEIVKFLLLVIILGGTIVVVALLRPIIFGKIVPAVLGANITITPPGVPVGEPAATVTPMVTIVVTPELGITPTVPAVPPTPTAPVEPTAEEVRYTVQAGDNLVKIAERFGVTVAAIRQANPGITNANYIQVGMVLVIPRP